jgi:hypothetical protein
MFASRGVWSLGIFVVTNWMDLAYFYRSQQAKKQRSLSVAAGTSELMQSPPKEEEELVQLNIALQKEIVRFTAIGIQRAVKEIDDVLHHKGSRTSSIANSLNFFVRISLGIPHSFLIFFVETSSAWRGDLLRGGRHRHRPHPQPSDLQRTKPQ